MLLVILKAKKLLGRFEKKNCEKQIKEFKVEKVIKRIHYMLNRKAMIGLLTVGLIKMSEYFPESNSLGGRVKF